MSLTPWEARRVAELDPITLFAFLQRDTALPQFDRRELTSMAMQWCEIKARTVGSGAPLSKEGSELAFELAVRLPAILDFASKQNPDVLTAVYHEIAALIVRQSPWLSRSYLCGKAAQLFGRRLSPENIRQELLNVTGSGGDSLILRANLAEQVLQKLYPDDTTAI